MDDFKQAIIDQPVARPLPTAVKNITERTAAAAAVARQYAENVDAEARLPIEAIKALKETGLLGVMVPEHLQGEGRTLGEIADICFTLAQACSSTAMIFAMHQIKAACLVRHHGDCAWQTDFLCRMARDQLLLASSTTEGRGGGAVRSSAAPVETSATGIHLNRSAGVVSYGEYADAIVTTARRQHDAGSSDQVLVVFPREDYRLQPTGSWDTLGMRGTCSRSFTLEASGGPGQIVPLPYADIHAQTMTPVAHILWAAVWAGIAAEAVERARSFLRDAARSSAGQAPPGSARLTHAKGSLHTLYSLISAALNRYEAIGQNPQALAAVDYQTSVSLLKVQASEIAVDTVIAALRTCGLSGYRNDSQFSMGRLLRDVLSGPLMINNERVLADLAAPALIERPPLSPWGGNFN